MDNRDMRLLKKQLPESLAQRLELGSGVGEVLDTGDMRLYRYGTGNTVDLDLYRALQTAANKMKIDSQWVPEAHIALLSRYMLDTGVNPVWGICHGTRRGNEQMWFRQHLGPKAWVFGTEISDTARDFPFTIQWDFHDVDPVWVGKMDLVYSNSWDHAHDPERAFAGWAACLAPGGLLLLDHGWNYQPERVSAMDPFGISEQGLCAMLDRVCAAHGRVTEVIDGGKHRNQPIRTIVFRAHEFHVQEAARP